MRELAILAKFREPSDCWFASLQQVFRQLTKLRRHFHKRILLAIAAMASQQLQLSATEITVFQMVLDVSAVGVSWDQALKGKQSLRRGAADRLAE